MNLRSLRWQVQGGHLIMILIGMPIIAVLFYLRAYERTIDEADLLILRVAAATEFTEASVTSPTPDMIQVALWVDGERSDGSEELPSPTQISEQGVCEWIDDYRVTRVLRDGVDATLVAGMPRQEVEAGLTFLPLQLTLITLGFTALALGMGWWASDRVLRPIERFSKTARRISESATYEPIDLSDTAPDLHELGAVLNDAFQRLQDSLQKQRQLTADASHELRTPVSLLLLELESALRQQRSPEEYEERIAVALEATRHLKKLVDGLLILARSDAGMMPYEMRMTDLEEVVLEVVRMLEKKAATKGLQIETDLSPILHMANEESMRQLLLNLLDNALEHARNASRVVIRLEQEKNAVILIVADDGQGIPSSAIPHLFDRFYRVDEARTAREAGHLGLGLAICQTIVEAHKGTIAVGASEWGGAEFVVRLARHRPDQA